MVACPERPAKYASTGGWGFQVFLGGDPQKPVVTDAVTECFACHTPRKDHDYVYSTYIPSESQ
ncbi:MAG: cytochrome P460 family protein [Xanthobacteraceae bacterium]|nr:cytochrome P460 family protein [Xanthobacteraceae bacterium]